MTDIRKSIPGFSQPLRHKCKAARGGGTSVTCDSRGLVFFFYLKKNKSHNNSCAVALESRLGVIRVLAFFSFSHIDPCASASV